MVCHQNTQTSSYHSHPHITPLAKYPKANHFKVISLPNNSLKNTSPCTCMITIQATRCTWSQSFPTSPNPYTSSFHTDHILKRPHFCILKIFPFPSSSMPIIHPHLPPAPYESTLTAFHSKQKCHLFKNPYPDLSDQNSSKTHTLTYLIIFLPTDLRRHVP